MKRKNEKKGFILMFLGILSAFGSFVMDMYLPTLPAMADYFGTTSSGVQLGLTTGMVGLAVGQLLFGPLSDRYGRRCPLLVAMGLFLLSTWGCLFSADICQFVAFRFVQGIAGAGGVVISRSIAADKYSGRALAAMLAVIGAVNGVASVAAPVAGGVLAGLGGWRGVFWFLWGLGAVLLAACLYFRESLPASRRSHVPWRETLGTFAEVLRNRACLSYILQYGFAMAVLFVNIASAPFIMQQHYGLTPVQFSLCFGINAVGMVASSALVVRMPSMQQALHWGNNGMLFFAVLLMLALSAPCNFWLYELLLFALLTMVGLSFTAASALAMDSERHHAGIASALLGVIAFAWGGIVSPLVGLGDIRVTAGILFFIGSLCAWVCGLPVPVMQMLRRRI